MFLKSIFGSANDRYLKKFKKTISKIIQNPRGFEKDLAQEGPLKTDVYVRP